MNIKSNKISFLVALLLSLTLAFIILRSTLSEPGLIEWTADFSLHYDISWERSFRFSTWNSYVFDLDNSAVLSMLSVYSWLLMLPTSEVAQRVILFMTFTLTSMSMFFVVFLWTKKRFVSPFIAYAAAIIASLIYTINPWVASETVHLFMLWTYALTPLIFYFTLEGVTCESWKRSARCALILTILIILNGHAHGILYSLLLVFLLMFFSIFFSKTRKQVRQYISNSLILLLVIAVFSSLLAAYWLLPYVFYFRPYIFQGQTWAIFKVSDIFAISPAIGGIFNVIRLHYPWTGEFLAGPLPTTFSPIMAFLSLSMPITAASAILLRKKDKTVMILSILALLFMFLANGSEPPLGGLYVWLAFNAPIISSLNWVLFKTPYVYLGYLSFSYAFLNGITASELLSKSSLIKGRLKLYRLPKNPIKKSMFVSLILLAILAFPALLNGNILLSGDLNGYYSPFTLPPEYQEANNWLSSRGGDFRVAWLPPSSDVFWSPYAKLPAIPNRNEISPLPQWASSEPVLSLGVTYLLPTHARIFPQYFVYDALLNNKTLSAGKLYGLANVKYIEYHNDTRDSENFRGVYESLLRQQDLNLTFNENYLSIFTNEHSSPYIYATKSAIINVGGLDALVPLSNIESYVPYELPIVFLEQFPTTKEEINALLDFGSILQFYGGKDFDDLALSTLGSNYIFAPSDYLVETAPLSPWDIDFFYSHLWVPARLGQFQGAKYDFDLNKKIIFASEPAELSFWTTTPQTSGYDIWVRTLLNPKGGKISTLIDDEPLGEVATLSTTLKGFKWIKSGEAQLPKGKHKITISNDAGFNAINLVAVVPSEQLKNHKMSLLNRIVDSDIRLSYLNEGALLDEFLQKTVTLSNFDTTLYCVVSNEGGTISVDTADRKEGTGSVKYAGTSDMYGIFNIWYDPPETWDWSNEQYLSLWVKTSIDVPNFRIYISDKAGNSRSWIRSTVANTWTHLLLGVDGYDIQSVAAPNLHAIAGINFGFTGTSNTSYAFWVDDLTLQHGVQSMKISPVIPSSYMIAIKATPVADDGHLAINVNDQTFLLDYRNATNTKYRYVGPMNLTQNAQEIFFSPSGVKIDEVVVYEISKKDSKTPTLEEVFKGTLLPFVINYKRINPAEVTVSVNASQPFILSFAEAYHDFWNAGFPKVPLNSITNGFFVNKTGSYTIKIEFGPEKYFHLGIVLSSLSLVFIIFCYISLDERFPKALTRLIMRRKRIAN